MAIVLDRPALPNERRESGHTVVADDARCWTLVAAQARDAARLRHAFRDYLETYGDPASDFDAAEAAYGELVNTCVRHAPGEVRVEFCWSDRTLAIVDGADRLRSWPFCAADTADEPTHHAYAILSACTGRIHVTRDAEGGTRATVVLPVRRGAAPG